jgi:hypothetical protein
VAQWGTFGSVLCCGVIAYSLLVTTLRPSHKQTWREMGWCTLVAYGLPFFTTVIPYALTPEPYIDVGPYCWFKEVFSPTETTATVYLLNR